MFKSLCYDISKKKKKQQQALDMKCQSGNEKNYLKRLTNFNESKEKHYLGTQHIF